MLEISKSTSQNLFIKSWNFICFSICKLLCFEIILFQSEFSEYISFRLSQKSLSAIFAIKVASPRFNPDVRVNLHINCKVTHKLLCV